MPELKRYRPDDLRRLGAELGAIAGLSPQRAALFVGQLLWFDLGGTPEHGFGTLPTWLHRMEMGEVVPTAEGEILAERLGTAVLNGKQGVGPLVLSRAGELAVEKSRDAAIGLVKVVGLSHAGPTGGVAASLAVGPQACAILGPGPAWSLALPASEGPPAVYDSTLEASRSNLKAPKGEVEGSTRPGDGPPSPVASIPTWAPWAQALVPDGGYLVAVLGIRAFESLSVFHERVTSLMQSVKTTPGCLTPDAWEASRARAFEHGLQMTGASWDQLLDRARRAGVSIPEPIPPSQGRRRPAGDTRRTP